jgi:beta-glucosidase/6-phospho-beta-glucosidase/beta-galactosidase
MQPLEVWGGVECTCNRVGDAYFDQLAFSGHDSRRGDFDRTAELGIITLRYGLLWERHEADPSWQWSDRQIDDMASAGIEPIVGLVHHGSGPAHTSLLDPEFPEKLAAYAGEVASRYPQISAYTPVNEPNTTARFSGLYGVWYPHHLSRQSYVRALLVQLKATVLSMRAIRRVRADARLVQTEDVGCIWSTPQLALLRDVLDERRWLSFDLLCGLVTRHHPLYEYMLEAGMSDEEILWFGENPCPPHTVGINYYVTSDRYLDHRIHQYPADRRSAEGPLVDIEAVRIRPEGIAGFGALLNEAWERFRIPVAITEVHLGCDDAFEQIRWAAEAWESAQSARRAGVECQAVTFWALLGSYFWSTLCCRNNGHYEPGVFDVRNGTLVPTELAEFVKRLAGKGVARHSALRHRGWWRQPSRLLYEGPRESGEREELYRRVS